jgi:hypothetical protein
MKKIMLVLLLALPMLFGGALEDRTGTVPQSLEDIGYRSFDSSLPVHVASGLLDMRLQERAKREERVHGWEELLITHRTSSSLGYVRMLGPVAHEFHMPANIAQRQFLSTKPLRPDLGKLCVKGEVSPLISMIERMINHESCTCEL